MRTAQLPDHLDDCSVATPRTSNSGGSGGYSTLSSRGSGKTARELQLEQENETLKGDFAGVRTQLNQMQAFHHQQMQELHASYQQQLQMQQAQISQLQMAMAQLQTSLQSTHVPPPPTIHQTPRKLPQAKRPNTNASPGFLSSTVRQLGKMAVSASHTVAPMAPEGDAVTPEDAPMEEQLPNV